MMYVYDIAGAVALLKSGFVRVSRWNFTVAVNFTGVFSSFFSTHFFLLFSLFSHLKFRFCSNGGKANDDSGGKAIFYGGKAKTTVERQK